MGKNDVFISYSRKDYNEVIAIKSFLEQQIPNLSIWFDMDGIESGEQFKSVIIKAINNSNCVIYAMSEHSQKSEWVQREIAFASKKDKRIIPLLLNGAKPSDEFLFDFGDLNCIDSSNPLQLEKLVRDLNNICTNRIKGLERNENDNRFAKYYDNKGFPRQIPQKEHDVAVEELMPFVKQNIAEAKMLLGFILWTKGDSQGLFWLREAELAGNKLAYYIMGSGYYLSTSDSILKRDCSEAEKRLLELFNVFHNGYSASILSDIYTYSENKCDYKKAFEYATIAAEDGEPLGFQILGSLYLNGWGIQKNVKLALENYKTAAANGDGTAMNQIGIIFMGNEDVGENPKQSFYWFNEAAKINSDKGMYNLGCCYRDGFGVETDVEKAVEWFKKAAEAGHVDSMCELGTYYKEVLADYEKAKFWYLKAANLGNAEGQYKLAVLYSDVFTDYKETIRWYKKAMEQRNPWAYRNYAWCLWKGTGVKENKKKAIEMMQQAIILGHPNAEEELDEMQKFVVGGKKSQSVSSNELYIPEGTTKISKLIAPEKSSKNWKSLIDTLVLPSTLKKIQSSILNELPNLKKIVIPKNKLVEFGKMLPYDWWRMYYDNGNHVCPEITIPDGKLCIYPYGTSIVNNGDGAKDNVLIPPTCSVIADKVFRNNDDILSIIMTDSVEVIGDNAFAGCQNMTSIRLSNNLTKVSRSMLEYCKSLKEIEIPKGVTSIGQAAFANCKSLTKVTIPFSVKNIEKGGLFGLNPFQCSESLTQIAIPKGSKKHFQNLLKGFSDNPANLLVEIAEKRNNH